MALEGDDNERLGQKFAVVYEYRGGNSSSAPFQFNYVNVSVSLDTDAELSGRAISKTDDEGEPSYAEFGIALGDDVFFGNDSVAEVRWANARSWRGHVVLTADEDTTEAGLRRAKQRGWRTILAVNANPLELKRRAATHNEPVTNLSDVLATQLAVADPQTPITWEFLCEDDSSGTGFSYAPCPTETNAATCLRAILCNPRYDLLQSTRKAQLSRGQPLAPSAVLAMWEQYLAVAINATDLVPEHRKRLSKTMILSRRSHLRFANMKKHQHPCRRQVRVSELRAQHRPLWGKHAGAGARQRRRGQPDSWHGLVARRCSSARHCVGHRPQLVVGGYQRLRAGPASLAAPPDNVHGVPLRRYAAGDRGLWLAGHQRGSAPDQPSGGHLWLVRSGRTPTVSAWCAHAPHYSSPVTLDLLVVPMPIGMKCVRLWPGTPDTAVAVVVPRDSGWNERPQWASRSTSWDYASLPARRGSRAIDGLFSHAFPGTDRFSYYAFPFGKFADGGPSDPPSPFARSAITPKYAPDGATDVHYAEAPLPFGVFESRAAASSYLKAAHRDPSPFRPMVDTRWGSAVEVLAAPGADSPAEAGQFARVLSQSRYSVAVLLGDVLVPSVAAAAREFANAGGSIVVAAGTALPAHAEDLTGLNFTGEIVASRAWQWAEEAPVHEPLLLAAATLCELFPSYSNTCAQPAV